MAYIFDGKKFALEKEEKLLIKVNSLGRKPKMVSIIIGDDPGSIMYQNLKKKAAERIGAEVQIKMLNKSTSTKEIIKLIKDLNGDNEVQGIMVQLPLPVNFAGNDRDEIINTIAPEKDVDGLKHNSKFTPPTAKAVLEVFSLSEDYLQIKDYPGLIVVVGGTGFIGRQIVRTFEKQEWNSYNIRVLDINTFDKETLLNADAIVSVTGVENLITGDMVKKGAVLIDVGAPKGDIEKKAYEKASFVSPVPGGIGPVNISCLMENLINAAGVV